MSRTCSGVSAEEKQIERNKRRCLRAISNKRQGHRFGPDLFVAGHGRAAVEADDHRPFAFFFDAAQRILNQLLVEKAAVKILAQERMMQAQHLVRQQAMQRVALLDFQEFFVRPLENFLAQRLG